MLQKSSLKEAQTASYFTYQLTKPRLLFPAKHFDLLHGVVCKNWITGDVISFHPVDLAMNMEVKSDRKPLQICK